MLYSIYGIDNHSTNNDPIQLFETDSLFLAQKELEALQNAIHDVTHVDGEIVILFKYSALIID